MFGCGSSFDVKGTPRQNHRFWASFSRVPPLLVGFQEATRGTPPNWLGVPIERQVKAMSLSLSSGLPVFFESRRRSYGFVRIFLF